MFEVVETSLRVGPIKPIAGECIAGLPDGDYQVRRAPHHHNVAQAEFVEHVLGGFKLIEPPGSVLAIVRQVVLAPSVTFLLQNLGIKAECLIAGLVATSQAQPFLKSWEETFSQQDSQYSTSMLRDIERGGQTEVEHILGFMLEKAIKAQIPCNTLLLAYTNVKAFEQRRAAGRLS